MSNASSTASSDTLMTTHLANNVRSHTSHCNPRPQPVGLPSAPRLRDPSQLLVLIILASFDHMLLKPWLKSRKALSSRDVGLTRWFFVHSLANLFVCACAFNSMRAVLADTFHALDASHHPNTSAFSAGTQWPLTIINSVHVYHMIGGFRLGAEPATPTKRASPSFISPDGVEGFNFEGGIDEGDLSPTKKTKIKRGRATPPQHKLPILFF